MIKGSILQEDIEILNVHAPNRMSDYVKICLLSTNQGKSVEEYVTQILEESSGTPSLPFS